MAVKHGSTSITNIKHGSTTVYAAFHGGTQVFEATMSSTYKSTTSTVTGTTSSFTDVLGFYTATGTLSLHRVPYGNIWIYPGSHYPTISSSNSSVKACTITKIESSVSSVSISWSIKSSAKKSSVSANITFYCDGTSSGTEQM